MGLKDHDSSIAHDGRRDDIDLIEMSSDPSSERIEVQCSVCDQRFHIPRKSKRQEVSNAKKVHYDRNPIRKMAGVMAGATPHPSSGPSPAGTWEPTLEDASSDEYVVPPKTEGRRYLKRVEVDDVILSVFREASSGASMLHAKMIDQTLSLLGREVPQATFGYPRVMYQSTSDIVDLDVALRRCSKQFHRLNARRLERTNDLLEENREWRARVAAFTLLASPTASPEDFTAEKLDLCIDLLCLPLPHDSKDAVFDEDGNHLGTPPRPGTHVPANYMWNASHECILDYHPPGSVDSPVRHLPVLVDIVARDRSSYRRECVLQLQHSGELIKTWMSIDDRPYSLEQMKHIFPQVAALLANSTLACSFQKGEAFPPPERITAKVEAVPRLTNGHACLMLEHSDEGHAQAPPLGRILGLTAEEVRMPPPTDDDGGAERRLQLKRNILEAKAEECLQLMAVVNPGDGMLTPGIDEISQYKLDGPEGGGPTTLASHTRRLLRHVGTLPLRVQPRKLPSADAAVEQLEAYIASNSIHRSIAALHARQGDRGRAVDLERKSVEQLEQYWATLTR